MLGRNIQMATGLTASLSDLIPNTTYYAFVRTLCGPVWSDWVVTEFTTDAVTGTNTAAFKGFKAYPNPVTNILSLDNVQTIDKIQLYNLTGQLVFAQDIDSTSAKINLEQLSAGVYMLTVHANESVKSIKVIKQ